MFVWPSHVRVLRHVLQPHVKCLMINSACQRSTSSLALGNQIVQESNNVPQDTRYFLLGTEYFLSEAITVLWNVLPFGNEIFLSGKQ